MNDLNVEKALELQGFIVAPVVGDSMLPMLDEKKDSVKIVPVSGELKKYDLPLYRRPDGKYVLHRIIGVGDGYYVIRGDNTYQKEKVPRRWVVGVTEGFFKDGKYVPVTHPEYVKYVIERCASVTDREITVTRPAAKKKQKLFPGYYDMVIYYPCLERAPFLLPIMWGARLIKKSFSKMRGKK